MVPPFFLCRKAQFPPEGLTINVANQKWSAWLRHAAALRTIRHNHSNLGLEICESVGRAAIQYASQFTCIAMIANSRSLRFLRLCWNHVIWCKGEHSLMLQPTLFKNCLNGYVLTFKASQSRSITLNTVVCVRCISHTSFSIYSIPFPNLIRTLLLTFACASIPIR